IWILKRNLISYSILFLNLSKSHEALHRQFEELRCQNEETKRRIEEIKLQNNAMKRQFQEENQRMQQQILRYLTRLFEVEKPKRSDRIGRNRICHSTFSFVCDTAGLFGLRDRRLHSYWNTIWNV